MPGAGGENDEATFKWFGDFAGTTDMDTGGLIPPGMGVFAEVKITTSMAWGFDADTGLTLGQMKMAGSAVFVIGNAKHEDVRLEVPMFLFTAPCVAGDSIEADASLTIHAVSGEGAPLLSIPGATAAIYIPCNMEPAPKEVVMMVTDRGPVTVVTPISSLEIIQIDFKIYGDKSMSGTIKAKPIDIEAMPNSISQFAGSITFDTTSGSLFMDADFAWKNEFVRIRASGSFGIGASTTACASGEWQLNGSAAVSPGDGMDDIIADVSVSHLCDGTKEVYNLTGQIQAFELKQVGLQIVKGRIEVNGLTNDTAGHPPHLVWNGTVVGEATLNTEASDNTLPALGSFETTITSTTKFSVIGKHLAFTYFGANVTFQYSLGDEDSDTFMKLSGAVEFAMPCNPGSLGKGRGLFTARMGEFKWDMKAYVTVYCGNDGPEDPVVTVSAQTIGGAVHVDPIKPTSKAPGTKRLELDYDELLSTSAFKFNLRRYISGRCT